MSGNMDMRISGSGSVPAGEYYNSYERLDLGKR